MDSAQATIKFKCKLGLFDLQIEHYEFTLTGDISIQGSLSSNQQYINENYRGYQLVGDLNLGFNLVAKQQPWYQRLAQNALYAFVKTYYFEYFVEPKDIVELVIPGIIIIGAPELIPVAGVGALLYSANS